MKGLYKDFDFSVLESPDFKEDSVREVLIKPLLNELGYSATGNNKIIRSKKLIHPIVKTGTGSRKIINYPDYTLLVNDKYTWVLDAKSPKEEIKYGENVEQTYFYAIHPEIRVELYALCNGREFILFKTNEELPLLHFNLSEIEKHWNKITTLLSPKCFIPEIKQETKTKQQEFDYMSRKILQELPVRKQAAKRHFGVHGYFTKQAWNVVQKYIENFTKPGDVVLDPFGGSGVTLVEALMLGRKAINIDINPLSIYIVKNLIRPVSINELHKEVIKITKKFEKNNPISDKEIEEVLSNYPFPKGIKLPKSADVDFIEELFTRKQLAQLAYLKHLILTIKNEDIKNSLLLSFSSTITKINRTYHPSKSRGDNAGNAAAFAYYRYRLAKEEVELNIMKTFNTKVKKIIAAKKEMSPKINSVTINNANVYKGTATNLKKIASESIDYIYTDPPYGSKIQYLDLSIMWNAWLDLDVTEEDYEIEVIEKGEHNKSSIEYCDLLEKSIKEMYRVLKFNRWMSFVFAHKDPKYWHLIVNAAEKYGFEYAGAVKQSNGQSSFKKRQNPFSVLHGQLIINFKKVKSPKAIQKIKLGADIYDIVINTIEAEIAKEDGATLEQINDALIIQGLELGFLDILSKEYKDLTEILMNHFDFEEETKKFFIRKNQKFKTKIPVAVRIRYFLISYLRRKELEGESPHFDDIILDIMPLLKNGDTPKNQTILKVLEEIAVRVGNDRWKLKQSGQMTWI